MARLYDLVYMTSSSSGTPFSTSSVTGYKTFQNVFDANEEFIASFKDGSNHYASAWCHLDGSNNVVVDEYIFTSSGIDDNTEPTFSGTVDIVLGSSSVNTTNHRPRGFDNSNITSSSYLHRLVAHEYTTSPTNTFTGTANRLCLSDFVLGEPGWYYQIVMPEIGATTGDYRVGLYDTGYDGNPTEPIISTAVVTHGTGTADVASDFDNTLTITNITQANPGVVTYTGTDPSNGQRIYIEDVVGMTEVNNRSFIIANVNTTSNTFELKGENTTAHTAYTSGGTIHFPKFLAAGEYVQAIATAAAVQFQGHSITQKHTQGLARTRSSLNRNNYIFKSFTFAALPSDPLSSGTWDQSNSTVVAIALKKIAD